MSRDKRVQITRHNVIVQRIIYIRSNVLIKFDRVYYKKVFTVSHGKYHVYDGRGGLAILQYTCVSRPTNP